MGRRTKWGEVTRKRWGESDRIALAFAKVDFNRVIQDRSCMRYFALLVMLWAAGASAFGQESPAAPPRELPKLESFSTANVDRQANPCDDFYSYADGKWIAAHPIPADQVVWGVGNPLELWNESLLAKTLEQVSEDDGKRTENEQKVGDYYFACMDTKNID